LSVNNRRSWMERQRDRYRFAVREPLAELCRALTERYVEPVLRQTHGWDLETRAGIGRALSSVVKNDYGRSVPYHEALWITFYRRDRGGKRDDVQLFVRLAADGVSFGIRLGRDARAAGRQFRDAVRDHADMLYQALAAGGTFAHCRFGHAEDLSDAVVPADAGELRDWAAGRSLVAGRCLSADDPLLTSEDLVGEILLTFDRLLPAYVCAVADDALPFLNRRIGRQCENETDRIESFRRATSLSDAWLRRALDLIALKRQLILQGVPGTGKTFVARHLARLLTHGRDDAVRLVQFHPSYSYEEFVEGIKPRTIEVDGRHEVTYPVEDGLLCSFAAEAAREPSEPFVLLIDEINRGNLPRIFGELLYLLEYRDQALTLPYSKRAFRLPANLYLIGTMNAADRSVAHIDQALRRRFSFLEMPPDAAVLARWLEAHPPRGGDAFAGSLVKLFEELNARLTADLGVERQIGHSYFMLPELDDDKLAAIWDHHICPLLAEYFSSQPGRAAAYNLSDLLHGRKAKRPVAAKSR
jgi:MoxR-like ATPase